MAGRWFAKRFPRRLSSATAADLARMAWSPSYRAPHPSELLHPGPFTSPGPPPMPAAERKLLDAVLADPDSDEPRLRYAEWCDRQGDPRGEFIRTQIALAKEPTAELQDREADLVAAHGDRWLAPFTLWSARDVVFRRGFAEAMSLAGRAFISLGDGLFRTTPLRDVRLVAVAPFLDELARTANLSKLDRLDLSGNRTGPAGVRELAGSPHLSRCGSLDLSRNGLGAEGVRELLAARWWGQLAELSLAGNDLRADDVRGAINEVHQYLDLSDNPLGPAITPVLDEKAAFSNGGILKLSSTYLGPDGAAALARVRGRPWSLDLGFNGIGDDGIPSLVGSPLFEGLRHIVLRGNRIGPVGAAEIARVIPHLHIPDLDLSANFLGDDGALTLFTAARGRLLSLDLANNQITAAGIDRLVDAAPPLVSRIGLAWNRFGDSGVRALARSPNGKWLLALDLSGTDLGDAGAVALAESPYLGELRVLRIGHNPRLSAGGVEVLRKCFGRAVLLR